MNFNEMKLAIYESYSNGEITRDAASRLINSFENASIDHELDLALEAVDNAESSFMESAMQYSTGEVAQEVFEAEAKSFGDAVKKAWAAFKKWVKDIIDKIGKKISAIKVKFTSKEDPKAKVLVPFNLEKMKKFIDDAASHIKAPFDFADAWWDKIKSGDVPTILKTIGVAEAVNLTVLNRNKLLGSVKDSLMKISSKLNDIESKGNDTNGIHILRTVVSAANKVIMTCASAINTRSDGIARMDAIDEIHSISNKVDDRTKASDDYKDIKDRLDSARSQLIGLTRELVDAEAKCKEKLAAITNLTPDPNNGIYAAAVKEYANAMREHESIMNSIPAVKKRVDDLKNGIKDYFNDYKDASDNVMNAYSELNRDFFNYGSNAVRACVLDSNILCHSAIKAKKKNDQAYDGIVKLYKERISEAKATSTLTRDAIKDHIRMFDGFKMSKIGTKYCNSILKKLDSYDAQIASVSKLADANGIN